jgi:hypothetical protein
MYMFSRHTVVEKTCDADKLMESRRCLCAGLSQLPSYITLVLYVLELYLLYHNKPFAVRGLSDI